MSDWDGSYERPASQATCSSPTGQAPSDLAATRHDQAQGILALAARCEAATGQDLELDAMIRCAAFAKSGAYVKLSPINGVWCIYETSASGKERLWEPFGLLPEQRMGTFTASLDAAMTLVPEGAHWGLGHDATGRLLGWAWVRAKVGDTWGEHSSPSRSDGFGYVEPYPASPALALCAAALRALASR